MVQLKKDEWELGGDIFPDKLIVVNQHVWNCGESKDAKFVTFTTKLEELQQAFATSSADNSSSAPKNTTSSTINVSGKGKGLNI